MIGVGWLSSNVGFHNAGGSIDHRHARNRSRCSCSTVEHDVCIGQSWLLALKVKREARIRKRFVF